MAASWDLQEKPGAPQGGWHLNEINLELNQDIDPDTGNVVYLNSLGLPSTWNNQNKS